MISEKALAHAVFYELPALRLICIKQDNIEHAAFEGRKIA